MLSSVVFRVRMSSGLVKNAEGSALRFTWRTQRFQDSVCGQRHATSAHNEDSGTHRKRTALSTR